LFDKFIPSYIQLSQLGERYPEEKRIEALNSLHKTASFYTTFFNRVQRKTIYKVSDFVEDIIMARQFKT